MADATCLNEDCEKDSWRLRKPVAEYDRGPTCPECGTTRVETTGGEQPDASADSGRNPQGQRPEQAAPARAEQPQQQQGQQNLPSTAADAAAAGGQVGDVLATISNSGSPEEQAEAKETLFSAVGGAIAKFGQRAAQREKQQAQRSKQTDQSEISRVEEYVSCPECNSQLTNVPSSGQFKCGACGTLLEV